MDPFAAAVVGNLTAGLCILMIQGASQRLQEYLAGDEKLKAVNRCLEAGIEALAHEVRKLQPEAQQPLEDIFLEFFHSEEVGRELAPLLKGSTPDFQELAYHLEECGYSADDFPELDVNKLFDVFARSFVQAAVDEPVLQPMIMTGNLVTQTNLERRMADNLDAIREETVDKPRERIGPILRLVLYEDQGGGYVPIPQGGTLPLKAVGRGVEIHSFECQFGLGLQNDGDTSAKNIQLVVQIDHSDPREIKLWKYADGPRNTYPSLVRRERYVGISWPLGGFVCHPGGRPILLAYMKLIIPRSAAGQIRTTQFSYQILTEDMGPVVGSVAAEVLWTSEGGYRALD